MKHFNLIISAFLVVSMIMLAVLVPGGPIETRNFSHIDPSVLALFNIFLTSLGIVSLSIVFFVIKSMKWAYCVAFICGCAYFLVYVLDLAQIFPKTPDAMPTLLLVIEILGTLVSLPLMYYAMNSYIHAGSNQGKGSTISKYFVPMLIMLIFLGIGIVIFATHAAMRN